METLTLAEQARLYRRGWSCKAIGDLTGVAESTARLRLRAQGVELRPRGRIPAESVEVLEETVMLYRERGSRKAAELMGVRENTIHRRLRLAGEPRTRKRRAAPPIPDGYCTTAERAARDKVTVKTVGNRCRAGKIPGAMMENEWPYRWLVPRR